MVGAPLVVFVQWLIVEAFTAFVLVAFRLLCEKSALFTHADDPEAGAAGHGPPDLAYLERLARVRAKCVTHLALDGLRRVHARVAMGLSLGVGCHVRCLLGAVSIVVRR